MEEFGKKVLLAAIKDRTNDIYYTIQAIAFSSNDLAARCFTRAQYRMLVHMSNNDKYDGNKFMSILNEEISSLDTLSEQLNTVIIDDKTCLSESILNAVMELNEVLVDYRVDYTDMFPIGDIEDNLAMDNYIYAKGIAIHMMMQTFQMFIDKLDPDEEKCVKRINESKERLQAASKYLFEE